MSLLLGGAYAVSAGLIVYAIERGYIAPVDRFRYLFGWAVVGVLLAILSAALQRKESP